VDDLKPGFYWVKPKRGGRCEQRLSLVPVTFSDVDFDKPQSVPWCIKCNKQVDSVAVEFRVVPKDWQPFPETIYTGEVIMTVTCHGESFKVSNWYGVLSAVRTL
jgi:hypothetical protein